MENPGDASLAQPMEPVDSSNVVTTAIISNSSRSSQSSQGGRPTPRRPKASRSNAKRRSDHRFNQMDACAVIASLVALVFAILTISPAIPWAARLQYTSQIIIVGFLLGVMSLAFNRVVPYSCMVVERRFGSSSLQNYDGLLRWAPATSHLSLIWRTLIVLSIMLPLGLSVLYKRFTGGVGSQPLPARIVHFTPPLLPGLENIGSLGLLANSTLLFLDYTAYGEPPVDSIHEVNQPFGHSLLLISNTSAAALDIPTPNVISGLQQELGSDETYYLTTFPRGTVVSYNSTAESHRHDPTFWEKYYPDGSFDQPAWYSNNDNTSFGVFTQWTAPGDSRADWDCSWIFLGNFVRPADNSDSGEMEKAFQSSPRVHGFDIRRHNCSATFRITRASIVLERGSCSPDPLPFQYQYFQNSLMLMGGRYSSPLQQALGFPFDRHTTSLNYFKWLERPQSWLKPTYMVFTAAMYQAEIAQNHGGIHIQYAGPIHKYWFDQSPHAPGAPKLITEHTYLYLNETYFMRDNKLRKEGPTLQPCASLYFIVAVLPLLTVVAYLLPFLLILSNTRRRFSKAKSVAIPRGFNIVALLAGLDRSTLDVFGHHQAEEDDDIASAGKTKRKIILDLDAVPLHQASTNAEEAKPDDSSETDVEATGCRRKSQHGMRYMLRDPISNTTPRRKLFTKVASTAANTAAVSTMALAFAT